MKEKKNTATKTFLITLVLTVVLSILNWGAVTCWGSIKINRISLSYADGSVSTGYLYIPANASDKTPAPALLTLHGASGNARNHEQFGTEFARRGFVVLSIDQFGSGDGVYTPDQEDLFKMNSALVAWNHLQSLPFVDKDNMVINGHSIGSTETIHLAARLNPKICFPLDGYMGVYPSSDELYYTGNIICINGDADSQNTDERIMPLKDLFNLSEGINIDTLEYDKLYGSIAQGNAKAVYMVHSAHENVMYNKESMQIQLDYAQEAIKVANPIPGSNQVWMWQHWISQLAMFVFAFMLINFALMITEQVPALASVVQPVPRNIGLRKVGLWISIVCSLVFPAIIMRTGTFGLDDVIPNLGIFRMGRANHAFGVVVGIAILSLLTLLLFIFTDGKKQKATLRDYGLTSEGSSKLDWSLIGKAFLITLITLAFGFGYLRLQNELLHTDFYTQFWGYKPIAWNKFVYFIPYIIIWVICFIGSAIGMNVERRLPSTGDERKDLIRDCVINVFLAIVTITVVVCVQMYLQENVAMRAATPMKEWASELTRLWGMPVGIGIGAFGNTYLYKKTGNIWLGVFLMGILCCLTAMLYAQFGLYAA